MSTLSPAAGPAHGRSASIAFRAVLAVVLMVGFYLLALAIAGTLLWICYAMVFYGHRIPIKIVVGCVAFAGIILWSILPRFDRFTAPGPQLLPEEHPRLFKEIQQVAAATGQEMPAEVYLLSDVNAWVTQRGGIMGIGSRRVMGLGLALMRVLDVAELRAVLAHEFGHYYGGDTRLGPWVYKTRSAIGRTICALGDSWIQKPFLWYGKLFLRITHAVSRRQEFAADHLAATVTGKEPLINGLQKTHAAAVAFQPYWENELAPVLSAGFCPPVAEGFARFMSASSVATALRKQVDEELASREANPYDTHPPLSQRIAAVRDLPARAGLTGTGPATGLLNNLAAAERGLLAALAGEQAVGGLEDAKWEEVGCKVYLPTWRRFVAESRALLAGLTPESLATEIAPRVKAAGDAELPEEERRRIAAAGAAVMLAALDAGASMECEPGEAVAVVAGEVRAEPFSVVGRVVEGKLDAAEWRRQCEAMGIAQVELAAVPTPGVEPPPIVPAGA